MNSASKQLNPVDQTRPVLVTAVLQKSYKLTVDYKPLLLKMFFSELFTVTLFIQFLGFL